MRLPNKVNSFNGSVISRFPVVLNVLEQGDTSPSTLYDSVIKTVGDISEFIEILDCLYALGKIEFNAETRLLHYVAGNKM